MVFGTDWFFGDDEEECSMHSAPKDCFCWDCRIPVCSVCACLRHVSCKTDLETVEIVDRTMFDYEMKYRAINNAVLKNLKYLNTEILKQEDTKNDTVSKLKKEAIKCVSYIKTIYQRHEKLNDNKSLKNIFETQSNLFRCAKFYNLPPIRVDFLVSIIATMSKMNKIQIDFCNF